MLFAATILVAVGYTLIYSGVKGDRYTIGGKPVWRQPWLPLVAVFTGNLGVGTDATTTAATTSTMSFTAADTAGNGGAPPDITSNPSGPVGPAVM